MQKLFSLFMLAILTTLFSCNQTGNNPPPTENRTKNSGPIETSTITAGNQCAIKSASQKLIKNKEEWETVWNEAFNGRIPLPEKPEIDFGKYWVIAAFAGEVSTGGHTLKIGPVEPQNDATNITVKHLKPGSNCITSAAIEYPYQFESVLQFKPENAVFNSATEEVPCN
ncbi:MAG: protease complex subunit PrcB family protein [Sphingobacteriales bacterium]|nr:MAG: protease complex subunit PrcB family protein [Sphingobacteriales bacterium]